VKLLPSPLKCFVLYAAIPLLTCFLSRASLSADIMDNAKLLRAIRANVSLDVMLKQIATSTSNCHFDSSTEALIQIQEAGKEGGWKQEDVKALQMKVIEISMADQKRLQELVTTALNVFENANAEDPNEYDSMMRTLIREGRAVVPYLLKSIEQESERKRGGIMDALGRIGDKGDEVVRVAILMLFDRSKPVRLQAAKCVAALHGPSTCDDLVARLNNKNEKQDGVAMALGFLGDTHAFEPLVRLLKYSADSDARVCAAFSLGQLRARTPAATEALLEAVLDERDARLRDSAAQALALIGERRTPSYIIKAFERYRQGREDLLRHLSFFKSGEAIEFLIEKIVSDDPKIKKSSLEALRVLTGENLETSDEWRGWWDVNKVRPDWIRTNSDAPKIPDARSGDNNRQNTENENAVAPIGPRAQ
jgi:HEAT repeat protein